MARILKAFGVFLLVPGFLLLGLAALAAAAMMLNSFANSAVGDLSVLFVGGLFYFVAFAVAGFNVIGAIFYFVGHHCMHKEREIALLEQSVRMQMWKQESQASRKRKPSSYDSELSFERPARSHSNSPRPRNGEADDFYDSIEQMNQRSELE